jgi:soluble lytic murein transglycosylase-like protein
MYKIATYTILALSISSAPAMAASYGKKSTGSSVHSLATAIAQAEGVNPALVRAVLHVESTGRCHAVSSANARGAMQVKPATARSVGVSGNLLDCRTGITAGVRYLRQALAVNRGNVCAAASSYNTGLGITGRCSGYGRKVLAAMGRSRTQIADITADEE